MPPLASLSISWGSDIICKEPVDASASSGAFVAATTRVPSVAVVDVAATDDLSIVGSAQ